MCHRGYSLDLSLELKRQNIARHATVNWLLLIHFTKLYSASSDRWNYFFLYEIYTPVFFDQFPINNQFFPYSIGKELQKQLTNSYNSWTLSTQHTHDICTINVGLAYHECRFGNEESLLYSFFFSPDGQDILTSLCVP